MADDIPHRKLRRLERAFEALGCALASIARVRPEIQDEAHDDQRLSEVHRLVVEGTQKLAVAQSKITYAIQDEADGMITKWCGHRVKRNCDGAELMACGCGPGPF